MRKVRADNQHHGTHGAHQHHEGWTHLPAHMLFQRNQPRFDGISLRMLAFELSCQAGEFRLSACDRGAELEPSDDSQRISLGFCLVRQRPGNKDIGRSARSEDAREVERRWQNADYGYWPTV